MRPTPALPVPILAFAALLCGPPVPGQIPLPAGDASDLPRWRATIAANDGAPLVRQDVLAHTFAADGTTRDLQRISTDGDGQVEVLLPASWREHTLAAVFVKTLDVKRAGWQVVGQPWTSDGWAIGTVRLAAPRTIVSGKVSGSRPAPDAGMDFERLAEQEVTLWPEYRLPGADDGTWRWIDSGAEVDRVPLRGGGYEIRAPMMRMHWREDGTFDALGWPPPGPMRLHARSRYHLPQAPLEFSPGDRLKFEVARGGTLRARIRMPVLPPLAGPDDGSRRAAQLREDRELRAHHLLVPRVRAEDPDVELLDSGGRRNQSATDRAMPRESVPVADLGAGVVEYEWPSLPTATYTLELRLWGASPVVASIDEIQVRDPFLTDDSRLRMIDLRDAMEVHTVVVHGPGGQPIATEGGEDGSRGVAVLPVTDGPTAEGGSVAIALEHGKLEMFGPGAIPQVELRVPGYLPEVIRDLSGTTTVQLKPGLPVPMACDQARDLPPDAVLEAVLVPTEHQPLPLPPAGAIPATAPPRVVVAFGDLTKATATVTAPGEYRVHLRILDARYGDWVDIDGTERTVAVPAAGLDEPMTLAVDDAAVAAVLRRLRLN